MNRQRVLPFNENVFQQICEVIFDQHEKFSKEIKFTGNIIFRKFDETFTYKLYLMLEDDADIKEIEEFIRIFLRHLKEIEGYLFRKETANNLDSDFVEEFFIYELEPVKTLGKEFSDEFIEDFEKYARTHGVYFIYNDEEELIYIGKSMNLFERLVGSLADKKGSKYRFTIPNTKSDTHLYELYYISKMKPPLNKDTVEDDELTIELPELEFSQIKDAYK